MELKFRTLKANEIECRVAQFTAKGLTLLLYKDARVDQNILDETVGAMNWQRQHTRDNANCIVAIWDEDKKQWVGKEDTGTESYTEKEKGLASDSFKRACFNWGIGRELYSSPFIFIRNGDFERVEKAGKPTTYDKFKVTSIDYDENRDICELEIKNARTDQVVFHMGKARTEESATELRFKILLNKCDTDHVSIPKLCELYNVGSLKEFSLKQMDNALKNWDKVKERINGEE